MTSAEQKKWKRETIKCVGKNTHGKDIMLYNIPILLPICLISDICATHGVTTEMNAPDENPYAAAKSIRGTIDLANCQKTRQRRPEIKAEGKSRLKRPTASEMHAGSMRPSTPPAFITARTGSDMRDGIESDSA